MSNISSNFTINTTNNTNNSTEMKVCNEYYEKNIKDIIITLVSSLLKDKPSNPVI